MKHDMKANLLLNLDKKKIMEPAELTLSGKSGIGDISFTHPELGNPFQYQVFLLLMDEWKGDRISLIEDTQELRDHLIEEEGYEYYRDPKQKLRRKVREENGVTLVTLHPADLNRWQRRWRQFINQFVIINYDWHLFMTIDRRLFKRTKNHMPYFALAQAEQLIESESESASWAGLRVGIEPIGTPTMDSLDYFEMFRMIGDKSACQLGVEDYERRHGQQGKT